MGKGGNGAGTRNRTADLLITNQSLYQLSYPGICKSHGVSIAYLHTSWGVYLSQSTPRSIFAITEWALVRLLYVAVDSPTLYGQSKAGVLYPKGGADRKNCLAFAYPDLLTESSGSHPNHLPLGLQAVYRPFESGHRGDSLGVQERQHLSRENTKHTLGPIKPKVGIE
jgi:hypothetical protein